ncbi:hypothetical protein RF11_03007 [Thelohanellus kitauei]|uniref:Uncharacterized protein n=1 Tax=Thelohanellus kitauei TaxID=669202 RepID=A0A0C2MLS6_THEKT|nr:hypothetical protein RF11_03007 [Thelohanellus kitauei]
MNEPDLDLMKSKIFPEFKIMSDLVSSVKEDTFLEDIICAYMIQTRIFRPADIHECKIFVAIWDILRDVGPEKTDLMKTCKICIPEIIEWVKVRFDVNSCRMEMKPRNNTNFLHLWSRIYGLLSSQEYQRVTTIGSG